MTTLLALPLCTGDYTVENNEDWIDAVGYWYDAALTQPVLLDDIAFTMLVRGSVDDPNIYFTATLANGFLSILSSGATLLIVNGGLGHAVGDVLTMAGGTFGTPATVVVTGVAGTGQTGGVITAARILGLGTYFALPGNPVSQGSSTGGGTNATFNFSFVRNALAVTVPAASFPKTLKPGSYVYEISGADNYNTRDVQRGAITVKQGTNR